jgi:putative tryptophan/tyrosine transport system substrate-binding protein
MIARRKFIGLVGGAAAAWPLAARAQDAGKMRTIGYLSPGSGPPMPSTVFPAFFDALAKLGWIEGKNVAFERRYAENRLEQLPELAAELVRLNVDVIVALGTLGPLMAKRATSTIPIVMTAAGDPLGSGLVASLARPGGNVTGMSLMAPDLGGKRLELLRELLPRLARVAVLWNAANPYPALVFKETQAAGRTLGIEVQSLEVRSPDDFDGAFEAARKQRPDALITVEDPLTFTYQKRIAHFAAPSNCRRFMDSEKMWWRADSCRMGQISLTWLGAPPATSTRSLKAPSLPIFQFSSRPRSNWCSTSRPPERSASTCLRPCSPAPTR